MFNKMIYQILEGGEHMNEYIDFKPQDALLPAYIRFSITKKAFGNMSSNMNEAIAMLTSLSSSKVILVTPGKDAGIYEVYTNDGTYLCTISDDNNALLIIGFYKNSLMKQNNAMKNGICFRVFAGIIIQINLTQPYEIYFDIQNGSRLADNSCSDINVANSISVIKEHVAKSSSQSDTIEEEDEEYQPEKKLVNLLQLAESYSILSSELEERNANLLGNIPYISIESAEYDRIDRVAYQFGVSKLDENTFKVGVQVEIEDKKQEKHAAEIIELVKKDSDSPATAIVLLFNDHIDISEFNYSGWFNLSFSTVNKDVQLAANEKIKTGEAPAKYMDVVFGKNSSNGFDNKNLTNVKAKLLEEKYPPNESQMNAIFSGINSRDVFLVMGPPGTGKTTVILEWVKYFVTQEHKRVLVSSQNNKAVDNVLARIADEKDIDIIRIGSESKLQSEIVPYMFENKVKTLRESIAENSDIKVADIDRIIEIWSKYKRNIENAISLNEKVIQSRNQFLEAIRKELSPMYFELEKIYEKYTSIVNDRKRSANSIKTLNSKIVKYEDYTKGIMKFISSFSYKDNLNKISDEVRLYDELKKSEVAIVNQYNSLRSKFQKEYELVKDVDFTSLYVDLEDVEAAIEKLKSKPAKYPENIWGFFDEIRGKNIVSIEDCKAVYNIIMAELHRASKLVNALTMWKEETVSHQNYALNEIVLESVDLVGATCIGINSQKRFASLDFDVTIIDEAGQIQVHNALVPMSVSNKLIMLGDHKQIPPTADQALIDLCEENGVKHDLLEKSLFEKMYNDLPKANKIMLDTQYRMPAEIADTISDWFYDGKYFSPDFKKNLKSQIPVLSDKPYVIIDTSKESNRFEKKIEVAGSSNALEAQIISDIIRYISLNSENDLKEVGVISAYKSQVKLIKNNVSKFLQKELVSEMVATLDSYQGQERDIILYSFTKSSNASPKSRRIGFLNELRRLNVAMTRCKKMLVLIGDLEFLGGCMHCDMTESGELIYEKSEKQFSNFINKMVSDVQQGGGELLKYKEFEKRMKAGDK